MIDGYRWSVPARVVRVIDGDTIVLELDLGWRVGRPGEHLRIDGLACAERGTQEGKAAKVFAQRILPEGKIVTVRSSPQRPTFERTVGSITVDGHDYAAIMIENGHGKAVTIPAPAK